MGTAKTVALVSFRMYLVKLLVSTVQQQAVILERFSLDVLSEVSKTTLNASGAVVRGSSELKLKAVKLLHSFVKRMKRESPDVKMTVVAVRNKALTRARRALRGSIRA